PCAGGARLRREGGRPKRADRPAISRALADARGHGDIAENADYDAAKERQGLIEARIRDIEAKLAHAHVIDPAALDAGGKVVFGATFELEDLESGAELSSQIVRAYPADI